MTRSEFLQRMSAYALPGDIKIALLDYALAELDETRFADVAELMKGYVDLTAEEAAAHAGLVAAIGDTEAGKARAAVHAAEKEMRAARATVMEHREKRGIAAILKSIMHL